MSLVAYENSDSSEYEEDEQENIDHTSKQIGANANAQPSTSLSEFDRKNELDRDLFNTLPQPSHKVASIIEEEDEYLHKKETTTNIIKPKSKITVPSLSDFKDVTSTVPNAKPRAENGTKSGLLSILPQPKNGSLSVTIKSLIPHVLTHKTDNRSSDVKKKESSPTVIKKDKTERNKLVKDYSDDSDDDDVQNDFFSINKPIQIEECPPYDEINVHDELNKASIKKEPKGIETYFKKETENHAQPSSSQCDKNYEDIQQTATSSESTQNLVSSDNVLLDEEAIIKLVGSRGKRKREEIQIVEVNQQEIFAETRELLLKGLMDDTSNRVSSSKKKGNEPTHMQKRKHQITYLAHQAKANEDSLRNKWANNRFSKRLTQSKYGF